MDEEYTLGSIAIWAGPNIPKGWLPCDGRELPIQTNQALSALLLQTYGGNGSTTFCLPDLRGMAVAGADLGGGSTPVGDFGGMETVNLAPDEMAQHSHSLNAVKATGNTTSVAGSALASAGTGPHTPTPPPIYSSGAPGMTQLDPASIGEAGSGAAHSNMQPYLALNYIIATTGDFPQHS